MKILLKNEALLGPSGPGEIDNPSQYRLRGLYNGEESQDEWNKKYFSFIGRGIKIPPANECFGSKGKKKMKKSLVERIDLMLKEGLFPVKNPGQLHRDLGVPEDQDIPKKLLYAAAKRKDKVGQRARAAINMIKIHH